LTRHFRNDTILSNGYCIALKEVVMASTEEQWRAAATAKSAAKMARVMMYLVLCAPLIVANGTIPRMFGLIPAIVLALLGWFASMAATSAAWVATKSGWAKGPATVAKNMGCMVILAPCFVAVVAVSARKALPMLAAKSWFEVALLAMTAVVSAMAATVASKQIERS
jgi:hypothetical protein